MLAWTRRSLPRDTPPFRTDRQSVAAGAGISLLDGEASHNPIPFFSGLLRTFRKEHIKDKNKEYKPNYILATTTTICCVRPDRPSQGAGDAWRCCPPIKRRGKSFGRSFSGSRSTEMRRGNGNMLVLANRPESLPLLMQSLCSLQMVVRAPLAQRKANLLRSRRTGEPHSRAVRVRIWNLLRDARP
jgi:hypothetical protein